MTTYIDAEGAIKTWVNAQTTWAAAPGTAVPKGAHLHRLRSPLSGSYILLSLLNGSTALTSEVPFFRARISGQVYGLSKEQACAGAVAYANAIERIHSPVQMGTVWCQFVADVTGPRDLSDVGVEPRYVVDADFYFQPV